MIDLPRRNSRWYVFFGDRLKAEFEGVVSGAFGAAIFGTSSEMLPERRRSLHRNVPNEWRRGPPEESLAVDCWVGGHLFKYKN